MGNCMYKQGKACSGVAPSDFHSSPPTVRIYGDASFGTMVNYLKFVLSFKPVRVEFVATQSPPVVEFGSETVSGSINTFVNYIDNKFPNPILLRVCDETVLPIVEAIVLHHRSLTWHLEKLARWADDLMARGGEKGSGDLMKGSPRMEVKKLGRSYSQLLEVMLEHAQMEERVVFPILERADRGLCKMANADHARDLPIMNGIKEDIKSISVLNSDSYAYQEALFSLSTRLKTLQENCKEHFEEEERELLPLIKAMELSKEQQENVFEQCLSAMQNTHSHLFRFFIEGLLPHDALHYLDLVIKSSDEELTASILCMITE